MNLQKFVRNHVEYRIDPLTSEQSRINPQRGKRVKQADSNIELDGIISRSKTLCVFCPDQIKEQTTEFPPDICQTGRIKKGQTTIVPNLYPFAENHAVGIITTEHFLGLDQFTEELIQNNLVASRNYILAINANNHKARFPTYLWNYMPSYAGIIVHPHTQIIVDTEPIPKIKNLLQESEKSFDNHKKNYWQSLVEIEKKLGQRYIGGNDTISVIASFSPRGFNEVQFIFQGISSLSELTPKLIDDFAFNLVKTLNGYKELGVGAFNLVTYSSPINQNHEYYWLNMKLISRPFPKGVYTNDTGSMERLYDVWIIDTLPEIVAERLRPHF